MFLEIEGKPLFPLELGQLYLIGKQINGVKKIAKNVIELEEEEDISQRHCIIEINRKEEAFVFDLVSLKGTLLNNKPINSLEKTILNNGDILKLGAHNIKYIHDGHDVARDSSGFLEVNKNNSDIIASSPHCISQYESHIKNNNFLVPSLPSTSLFVNSRKSDSFTIPETQYCTSRNSLNASDLSAAESIQDDNPGNLKSDYGPVSFGDDDLCIPETQEVLPACGAVDGANRQNPNLLSVLEEKYSKSEIVNNDSGSQFRICTQDYNEGFGEEESVGCLHSQIIPIVKHQMVFLNNPKENPTNMWNKNQEELSAPKLSKTNADQETTELRADCLTPDIFLFESLEAEKKNQQDVKAVENIDKTTTGQETNLIDEDEEDFLPTQILTLPVIEVLETKSLNELEKPCMEKENEDFLTLSDKENRCPVNLERIGDLAPTQLFEVATTHIRSAIKPNPTSRVENKISSLNIDADEEDDLLTQAFLQPSSNSISSNSSSTEHLSIKCFKPTLITENKFLHNRPPILLNENDKTPLKQTTFKMPEKDVSVLKKPFSAISETDLDLLMCTPQLIKDNISVGKTEDLKLNILAAKNNLLHDETDEEDDDDKGDLVKLINVPKKSLDFDKLLPHLNRRPERSKISEEQKAAKEAQKLYKFNISFGKEQEDKLSKTSISKSTTLGRDERHAARDKQKEMTDRIERTKTKERTRRRVKDIELPERKDEEILECKGTKTKESSKNRKRSNHRRKTKQAVSLSTPEKAEQNDNSKRAKTTRLRTRNATSDKTIGVKESLSEHNANKMPARRMTRLRSRFEETPLTSKEALGCSNTTEDDLDNVSTQPIVERKRKADASPHVVPVKVERRTRARSTQSQDSAKKSPPAVAISMTMVEQDLFQNLIKNNKGFWNVAKNVADCDLLVMDKAYRTFKFLLAMARGIPIVTSEYLKKLNEAQSAKEVRISQYLFADAEFEKKYKFSLVKSSQAAKKFKIFQGYEFLMTASILPNPEEIKAIIEASGGYVHAKTPPQPKENQKLYLVTAKEDKKDWHKYRRLNKNIIIVSTEAIMSAIMGQNCDRMTTYILT